MAMMDGKRTLTMSWDDLDDDDDDDFFESINRISAVAPSDLAFSDSDDSDSDDDLDAFQDSRVSFSTMRRDSFAISPAMTRDSIASFRRQSFRSVVPAPSVRRDSIAPFRHAPAPAPAARRDSFRAFAPIPSVKHNFGPIPSARHAFGPIPSARHEFGPIPSARHDFGPIPSARHEFVPIHSGRHNFGPIPSIRSHDDPNYNVWMAAPGSIRERRKKLFLGMGLDSNKQLLKENSIIFSREITRKLNNMPVLPPASPRPTALDHAAKVEAPVAPPLDPVPPPSDSVPSSTSSATTTTSTSSPDHAVTAAAAPPPPHVESSHEEVAEASQLQPETHDHHVLVELVRSRSDGDIDWETHVTAKRRKRELLGKVSKHRLTRTYSEIATHARFVSYVEPIRMVTPQSASHSSIKRKNGHKASLSMALSTNQFGAFFLIKNLDTGNEFIVNEYDQNGMWNKFSDLQTGKKLTAEEFEQSVGYSPIVKELMRRENKGNDNIFTKFAQNSSISKSIKMSKQRGVAMLKNISSNLKESMKIGEKDLPPASPGDPKGNKNSSSSQWIKVRHTGKQYKDLSALHLCQEIQAHEGSIWTMRFSLDGRYLASAGEDMVIHIWEVQECEIMSKLSEEGSSTPLHPSSPSPTHPSLGDAQPVSSDKKKKLKTPLINNKKAYSAPEYAHVPETVFALSDKPICSFEGHTEDVLDLSWSKSLMLLSSSMDKTVKLWDMETKSCLKTFTHSDYVTCIHFNPADDNLFISGSLDEKVRMWNIRNRRLVTYTDIYEMVTAVCYSPDGQEALIGTHKGNCRVYGTEDCSLEEKKVIETQKKKNQPKKITGFQFSPEKPSEVLITSADSRIRILDGDDVVHKFIGFRNTSSQIAASFSTDGKYVICASEDSQVYVFRREEPSSNAGAAKGKPYILTRSYENFTCKDVSIAITWPCGVDGGDAPSTDHPKEQNKEPVKKHIKRSGNIPQGTDVSAKDGKVKLPPLPKKGAEGHREEEKGGGKGAEETHSSEKGHGSNQALALWSPNWHWLQDGGEKQSGSEKDRVSAWGLVIVTAGLGGEIRAYQNFGHPRRLSGLPTTLF